MSHMCQNSYIDTFTHLCRYADYLLHLRWTHRRRDLDQSILILCGMDQYGFMLQCPNLWDISTLSRHYTTYDDMWVTRSDVAREIPLTRQPA